MMKKFISALLAGLIFVFPLLLTGCVEKHEDIDEYKWASYKKYSDYNKTEKLRGNKIYASGTIDFFYEFNTYVDDKIENIILGKLIDETNSCWAIEFGVTKNLDTDYLKKTCYKKQITICGTANGVNLKMDEEYGIFPCIVFEKLIVHNKDYSQTYTYSDFEDKSQSTESLLSAKIEFDSQNYISFNVGKDLNSGSLKGTIGCFFDGIDPTVDYRRMISSILAMQTFTKSIGIIVQSGDQYGIYRWEEDGAPSALLSISSFESIQSVDEEKAAEEYQFIMEQLKPYVDKLE